MDAQIGVVVMEYEVRIEKGMLGVWRWKVTYDALLGVGGGCASTLHGAKQAALRAIHIDLGRPDAVRRYTFDPQSDDGLVER
jgi:hypothetical protein